MADDEGKPEFWKSPEDTTDPEATANHLRALVADPEALANISRESAVMMLFLFNAAQAIKKMSAKMRLHYHGELLAIAKDLLHDLEITGADEQQRAHVIVMFLMHGDDDDGSDEVPTPDLPSERERQPA